MVSANETFALLPVLFTIYCARYESANWAGVREICIIPSRGRAMSSIKNMAPDTDRAQTKSVAVAIRMFELTRPNPAKRMASQSVRACHLWDLGPTSAGFRATPPLLSGCIPDGSDLSPLDIAGICLHITGIC